MRWPGRFALKMLGEMLLVAFLSALLSAYALYYVVHRFADFSIEQSEQVAHASKHAAEVFRSYFADRKDDFHRRAQIIANSGVTDVLAPSLELVDDNGEIYAELPNGEGVPHWLGVLRQAKPAEAAQGSVVFDAPARHYKLRITDENEQKTAFVDLPLNFNPDTVELPFPDTSKPAPSAAK